MSTTLQINTTAAVALAAATAAAAIAVQMATTALLSRQDKKRQEDEIAVTLPDWTREYLESLQNKEFSTNEEMVQVAIELSRRNVCQETGGPFGCAIFEIDTETKKATLYSIGVNRVTTLNNSTLHAEMVALQFAQKKRNVFSLSDPSGRKTYALYTSCEPCAMCLGGIFWSGISKLVCAATKDDAEAIGFDEGPVFAESYQALEQVGIKVVRNIESRKGAKVLQEYGGRGTIYNGNAKHTVN